MSVVYLAEHAGLRRKVALNDLGVCWSDRAAISNSGDNYFRTIAYDSEGNPARRRVVHEPVRRGLPQPERPNR